MKVLFLAILNTQNNIALSATKAEFLAAALTTQEALSIPKPLSTD